jgi:integrase
MVFSLLVSGPLLQVYLPLFSGSRPTHPLETFIALAMTGMRYGEMLALQWSDIDVEKQCLQVRRTVAFVGSLPAIGAPKTKESQRIVVLPPFVMEALVRHRERQQEIRAHAGEQWQDHDLVFCDSTGTSSIPQAIWMTSMKW